MPETCSLHEFLSFLRLSCKFDFDIEKHTFSERIRLQKYVFLAQRIGLVPLVPLDYSMYIRGPYSSALADIYFNSASWDRPLFATQGFDPAQFIRTIGDRDVHWLEVAATILFVSEYTLSQYQGSFSVDDLVERVQRVKTFSDKEIESVYNTLRKNNLFFENNIND